jgi:hypothetical protein
MTTTAVNLPLLVRDWLEKEYQDKCCFTTREYYDLKWDPKRDIEEQTVSQLMILPNAILKSPSDTYMIEIHAGEVIVHNNTAKSRGLTYEEDAVIPGYKRAEFLLSTEHLDYRAPSFFHELTKRIGCRCRCKQTKQPPPQV